MSADNTDNTGNNGRRKHDDTRRMEDCEVPSASKKPKLNDGDRKLDEGDVDDDIYTGRRLMTRKMYAQLFAVVKELPLDEKRDWMKNIFDMVESHHGCLSNGKHYYFSDEEPSIYKAFTEALRAGDLEKFQALKCFEFDEDDVDDDIYTGRRLMTRKMYAQLFAVVKELPLDEKRDWMKNIFDMVESHHGCLSNGKHYYFSDEEPSIYKAFTEALRAGDLEKFQALKCFEFDEDDF